MTEQQFHETFKKELKVILEEEVYENVITEAGFKDKVTKLYNKVANKFKKVVSKDDLPPEDKEKLEPAIDPEDIGRANWNKKIKGIKDLHKKVAAALKARASRDKKAKVDFSDDEIIDYYYQLAQGLKDVPEKIIDVVKDPEKDPEGEPEGETGGEEPPAPDPTKPTNREGTPIEVGAAYTYMSKAAWRNLSGRHGPSAGSYKQGSIVKVIKIQPFDAKAKAQDLGAKIASERPPEQQSKQVQEDDNLSEKAPAPDTPPPEVKVADYDAEASSKPDAKSEVPAETNTVVATLVVAKVDPKTCELISKNTFATESTNLGEPWKDCAAKAAPEEAPPEEAPPGEVSPEDIKVGAVFVSANSKGDEYLVKITGPAESPEAEAKGMVMATKINPETCEPTRKGSTASFVVFKSKLRKSDSKCAKGAGGQIGEVNRDIGDKTKKNALKIVQQQLAPYLGKYKLKISEQKLTSLIEDVIVAEVKKLEDSIK